MIQRVYKIIKSSTRVRTFITACKNFMMSAKVLIFCSLGILLNIFYFIHYILIHNNIDGWLADIVTTICDFILCAICLVSIWIILELVALIIEMKCPISTAEIEAKCIDADSRCFPTNHRLERNQPNPSDIERNVFAEELQSLRASISDSRTQHEHSMSLNQNVHFKPARHFASSRHNELSHQFQTDIHRPSTSVQRSKSLSSEREKMTSNKTGYVEQRNYSPSFLAPQALNQQKPIKVSILHEFLENSTSKSSDKTDNIYNLPSTEKLFEHSRHSTPELPSHLCGTSLSQDIKEKSDGQRSINASYFESSEGQVGGKQIESRWEYSSSNTQLISKSNSEVNESLENSSSEVTATASEGDSSWTEDSPPKIVHEPLHGNPNSTFSDNLCIPHEGIIGAIHKTLESNIENSNEFEITGGSKEETSTCEQDNSESTINSTSSNIKQSNFKLSKTSAVKKIFKTNKEIETTCISDMDDKAPISSNETTSSEMTTVDESSENDNVFENTSRSRECPSAFVKKDSDSTTNAACLKVKVANSNEEARPADLSKNDTAGTSFSEITRVTDTETKASLSSNKVSTSRKNKTETTFLPPRTTDSLGVSTEILRSGAVESSVTDHSSGMSHISKLESLTFRLNMKEGTKIVSKTKMMAEKFKRSLSTPISETQKVSNLKRKYESSSSDSSSENSSKETSNKRRAKRRTKSCSSNEKILLTKNDKESVKERKF